MVKQAATLTGPDFSGWSRSDPRSRAIQSRLTLCVAEFLERERRLLDNWRRRAGLRPRPPAWPGL